MIAHVKPEGENFDTQSYQEHALGVAKLCRAFAGGLTKGRKWQDLGYIIGLLHDFGKLQEGFQRYIRFASGMSEKVAPRVHHSATGALFAEQYLQDPRLVEMVRYCITGHHRGLYDYYPMENRLKLSEEKALLEKAKQNAPSEVEWSLELLQEALASVSKKRLISPLYSDEENDHPMLVRMLFSCLVDADALDTELFMDVEKAHKRYSMPTADFSLLRDRLREKTDTFTVDTPINKARTGFLRQCREHGASAARGIYSLFLPTGGGKTFSSMAWALESALHLGAQRIIYVIPYTSIITQTAQLFREVFGEENVLEHHSDIDVKEEEEESRAKLLAENWDVPIVVTTNVQFFESLYAHRVSRCRKLHNIARSVIVFDEVQMFPSHHLNPMLDAINSLCGSLGANILLCTATQPLFTKEFETPYKNSTHPLRPLDFEVDAVVPYTPEVFGLFDRAEYHLSPKLSLMAQELALRLVEHESALCIVNTRKDALLVYSALKEMESREGQEIFHLSRMMCSAHLKERLSLIKKRMGQSLPTIVVSTQLIEAGVDLDFPVVYRAESSLISIIQAGGRCNREGRRSQKGDVFVFKLQDGGAAFGEIKTGIQATEQVLSRYKEGVDVHNPKIIEEYYEQFYYSIGDFDKEGVCDLLLCGSDALSQFRFNFEEASKKFHLIDENDSCEVFVPYNDEAKFLIKSLCNGDVNRKTFRTLQRYRVTLSRRDCLNFLSEGRLAPCSYGGRETGSYLLLDDKGYDQETGIRMGDYWLNELCIA